MGKIYDALDDHTKTFLMEQKMFFVATAPRSDAGLINVSPKGLDSFRILDDQTVAYLDLTGSGVETIAHVKENGRLVMMFCSFGERPLIVRLHGTGRAVERKDDDFDDLYRHFTPHPATRAIIVLSVNRIADSCGWGVPMYEFKADREQFDRYIETKGVEGMRNGQLRNNMKSLDGLPGLSEPSV